MVGYRNHGKAAQTLDGHFETPRRAGYREGMTATRLIADRLARVYEVTSDVPGDMGAMLRDLDVKAGGTR